MRGASRIVGWVLGALAVIWLVATRTQNVPDSTFDAMPNAIPKMLAGAVMAVIGAAVAFAIARGLERGGGLAGAGGADPLAARTGRVAPLAGLGWLLLLLPHAARSLQPFTRARAGTWMMVWVAGALLLLVLAQLVVLRPRRSLHWRTELIGLALACAFYAMHVDAPRSVKWNDVVGPVVLAWIAHGLLVASARGGEVTRFDRIVHGLWRRLDWVAIAVTGACLLIIVLDHQQRDFGARGAMYLPRKVLPCVAVFVALRHGAAAVVAEAPVVYLRSFHDPEAARLFSLAIASSVGRHGVVRALTHDLQPPTALGQAAAVSSEAQLFTAPSDPGATSDEQAWRRWVIDQLDRAAAVVIDVGVPTPGVIWELEQARTRRAGRLLVVGRASAAPEVWKIISDPDRARAAAGLAYEVPVLGSAVERFETGFDAWLDCALGGAPLADFEQSPLAITSEQRAAAIAARASAPPPPDEPGETGIAAMRRGRPW